MDWLTGDEARQREPLLASDISGAIYAPQESQIKASHVAQAYWRAAANRGAVFYSHTEITGLQRQNNRVTSIQTARGETISCNSLVIAVGAWSARCGEWLNIKILVSPQRGQILSLRQPPSPLRHLVFGEAVYLAPKNDGTIIVGATKEEVGFDKQLTAGGIAWLLNSAIRLVPSLEGCAIEAIWAGLRPKTPDQQPILGKAPAWENVVLATGHGSVGIMLSAITGKMIAELVVTGKTTEIMRAFSVERFAGYPVE